MLGDSATPVALFTIGTRALARRPARAHADAGRALPAGGADQAVVHPALVFAHRPRGARARRAGLAVRLMVLTLTAALPSASNVSLLAERYGADNGRIARIIMASTVLAFVTFSAAAWLFGVGRARARQVARRQRYSVYRIPPTPSVTAHLVKLQPAPDLVDRVYRALLDAISDGSLAPGHAADAGRHRRPAGGLAPAGAAGAAPAEEGRPGASTRRAAASSSRRSTPPGSPRSTRCAARSTRSPRGSPPQRRAVLDPGAGRDRPARRARPRHPRR